MEIKILKEDKNSLDVEIDNLTIVELLRIYLNKEGVKLAAWKREHPSKNPILHIEASSPKKLLKKVIGNIQRELDGISSEFTNIMK